MYKYSIFERGMHWVLLLFIILKGCIFYFLQSRTWDLNSAIGWSGGIDEIIMKTLVRNLIYVIFIFIYIFIFYLKRKLKKKLTFPIVLLLITNLIFQILGYITFIGASTSGASIAAIVLILFSFFDTEKIVLLKENNDTILDDLN